MDRLALRWTASILVDGALGFEKEIAMLYVALYKNKPGVALKSKEVIDKSRKWWNDGGKPAGIKTLAIYGTLGTGVPEILVFETDSHEDIRKMISFWRDTTEFEVYPALDLAADFRKQGMKVS